MKRQCENVNNTRESWTPIPRWEDNTTGGNRVVMLTSHGAGIMRWKWVIFLTIVFTTSPCHWCLDCDTIHANSFCEGPLIFSLSKISNEPRWLCVCETRMPPVATKSKIGYIFSITVTIKDLGVIWKGFISWVCMPYMKSVSLTVQNLWPRLKFFATESQTDRQKLDAPNSILGLKKCILNHKMPNINAFGEKNTMHGTNYIITS